MLVKHISWKDTLDIRHRVLWPSKPPEFCIVEGDETANHFGAFLNGALIAVASTYEDAGIVRLRKFAVDPVSQGAGYGSQLLQYVIKSSLDSGARTFWCDARESACDFYTRFGLSVEGEVFYKSGVAYRKMAISFPQ